MGSDNSRIYTPDLQRPCAQHPRPLILGHVRCRTPQLIRHPLAPWPRSTNPHRTSIADLDNLPSITTCAVHRRPRRRRAVEAGGLGVRVGMGRRRSLRVRCRIAGGGVRVVGREGRLFIVEGGFLGFVFIAAFGSVSSCIGSLESKVCSGTREVSIGEAHTRHHHRRHRSLTWSTGSNGQMARWSCGGKKVLDADIAKFYAYHIQRYVKLRKG